MTKKQAKPNTQPALNTNSNALYSSTICANDAAAKARKLTNSGSNKDNASPIANPIADSGQQENVPNNNIKKTKNLSTKTSASKQNGLNSHNANTIPKAALPSNNYNTFHYQTRSAHKPEAKHTSKGLSTCETMIYGTLATSVGAGIATITVLMFASLTPVGWALLLAAGLTLAATGLSFLYKGLRQSSLFNKSSHSNSNIIYSPLALPKPNM